MSGWSLEQLFENLQNDIGQRLATVRSSFGHSGTKGDASETVWLNLLRSYLPKRYEAAGAHVVDSLGNFSHQIDVVIFDRQYSPFIFRYEDQIIVPAESVYAVFEAKQSLNAEHVAYAREKVDSVRRLHRTSIAIPHAGGTYEPKPLIHIVGGLLTLASDWKPGLGRSLITGLGSGGERDSLDVGCIADCGHFTYDPEGRRYDMYESQGACTRFLFELIARLQASSTVPMIDIRAYAKRIP